MEEYIENIIAVRLANNVELNLAVNVVESSDTYTLSVSLDNHLYEANADDIFPAFQKLRDALLLNGIGLKCYGAMINAHQSGMMSTCDKVFILTLGKKPSLKNDVAMIFDYTDIKEFPNTLEQAMFVEKWFESVKST